MPGRRRARRRAVCPGGDDGFTLIEVVVALLVLALAMGGVSSLYISTFTALRLARERQAATALANRAVEQLRALPFAVATGGQRPIDLTASGDVQVSGGRYYLGLVPGNPEIPTNAATTLPAPLQPDTAAAVLGGRSYTIRTYVARTSQPDVFRAVVAVRWASSVEGGRPREFVTQTLLSSPQGCVSRDTHPFAAPCDSFFSATATTGGGAVTVRPVDATQEAVSGLQLTEAALVLPRLDSGVQKEQVQRVSANYAGWDASVTTASGDAALPSPPPSGGLAVDEDPASPGSRQDAATWTQASGSATRSSGTAALSLTTGSVGGGRQAAAVAATGTPACEDLGGVAQTHQGPCSAGAATPGGTATVTAVLPASGGGLPVSLVSLGSSGVTPRAFTSFAPASATWCSASPAGSGCVRAAARRSLGPVALAQLPSGFPAPVGWPGAYVTMTGSTEAVAAQSGPGAAAPATGDPTRQQPGSTAAPSLTWYDPATSTPQTRSLNVPGPVAIPPLTLTSGTLQLDLSADLTVGARVVTSDASCAAACRRTVESRSPISGTVTYTVRQGPAVLSRLQIAVDFGTLAASSTYRAAPSAG